MQHAIPELDFKISSVDKILNNDSLTIRYSYVEIICNSKHIVYINDNFKQL